MTDIVERLRGWFKDVNAVSAIDLMDEAAAEIERLRTLAEQATHDECSVRDDGTVGERLVQRVLITQSLLDDNEKLRAENARLRLTNEEREAVEIAIQWLEPDSQVADELRELLERLK